jgi:hypothetical protein
MSDCLSRIRSELRSRTPVQLLRRDTWTENAPRTRVMAVSRGSECRSSRSTRRDEIYRQVRHGAKTLRGIYK